MWFVDIVCFNYFHRGLFVTMVVYPFGCRRRSPKRLYMAKEILKCVCFERTERRRSFERDSVPTKTADSRW